MKSRMVVAVTIIAIVLCAFPAMSLAADETIDLAGYASGGTITIHTGDVATIIDSVAATRTNIQIDCEQGSQVILSGVTIDDSAINNASPLSFTGSGGTLTLAAGTTNTLTAGKYASAVRVLGITALTIDGTGALNATGGIGSAGIGGVTYNDGGVINISGGTVTATGGSGGAGIGGGASVFDQPNYGGVTNISGGTVTATGGSGGAGIGGGAGNDSEVINISGGTVTATGGDYSAGIGGGSSDYNESSYGGVIINISGGIVTAMGGGGGAGIGGGDGSGYSSSGGTVTISGGTVIAESTYGAGIGGGNGSDGGIINISGGTVTAESTSGADIGSGWLGSSGGTLSLDGGTELTLSTNGTNAAVTLGDVHITDNSSGSNTITDGYYINGMRYVTDITHIILDITPKSGLAENFNSSIDSVLMIGSCSNASFQVFNNNLVTPVNVIFFNTSISCSGASPFSIVSGSSANLELCGSSTLSGSGYAGIHCPEGAKLTISGSGNTAGSLTATGNGGSAGIGGNNGETAGEITIQSGAVTAASENTGAGLGGGNNGSGGTITITGGTVNVHGNTSTGYHGGAGLGGGHNGTGGIITISGGTVNARSEGPNNDEGGSAAIGGGETGGAGSITISGGTVTASAGEEYGCGIGGGHNGTGGSIAISGGTVTATSGSKGEAAVGGMGDLDIAISGGTVNANGRHNGTGIGGGGSELDITISGGTVTAKVVSSGAGIGSGTSGSVGHITITGGTVTASGGNSTGAGIGGGGSGSGGIISISGGTIYAKKGATAAYDIGDGYGGNGTTLSISGSAAVFLATDACISPATSTHTYLRYDTDTEESYGYDIPSEWTPAFGSYLRLVTLSYNANSGSGAAPGSVTQIYNTTAAVSDGNALSRTGYGFGGWNTAADGSGASYAASAAFTFTANTTLYAKWAGNTYTVQYDANGGTGTMADSSFTYDVSKALTANGFTKANYAFAGWAASAGGAVVYTDGQSVKNLSADNGTSVTLYAKWTAQPALTSSDADSSIYTGGRITLTPNISGGTWSFDSSFVTLTQNSDGTVTLKALKSGTITVTYTVQGATVSYTINIEGSSLPSTGQDFTWVWALAALAVLAAILAAEGIFCGKVPVKDR